jgi:NTE family protein
MKTALVLSAGGMFGAYQAGVWSVLADCFEPDLIVGASIGAVNGWAIAGGCPPAELIDRWLTLDCAANYRWRFPIRGGVLDGRSVMASVDDVYAKYRRRVDCAVVVTDLARLRPRIFRNEDVTAALLRASTAIPCIFDQVRIGNKLYSDGGLLNALPIWAAAELGADTIIAVNAMTRLPGLLPNLFVDTVRWISGFRAETPAHAEVIRITPRGFLGTGLDILNWKRENTERWIEQGRRDALEQKPSIERTARRVLRT